MAGHRVRARGELERQVLRVLRDAGVPLAAQDVQERFAEPVPAYTTVMTVLTRMVAKEQVVRVQAEPGRALFRATRTDAEYAASVMSGALDAAQDRQAVLLRFAGQLAPAEIDILRRAVRPGASERLAP